MCRQQVQKTDGDPKIIPFALEILRSLSGNAQLGMDGKVRDIFSCRAVRKQTFAMGTYISIHCQHLQHLPQLSFVDTWDIPADRRLDLRFWPAHTFLDTVPNGSAFTRTHSGTFP